MGIVPGRVTIEDGRIAAIEPDPAGAGGRYVAAGFIDLHVHGWGGHDAMGGPRRRSPAWPAHSCDAASLRSCRRRSAPRCRSWRASWRIARHVAEDGGVLGANLEGPFLSPERRGAHDPRHLLRPADWSRAALEPLLDGLRIMTVAPELDGALELIAWLRRARA